MATMQNLTNDSMFLSSLHPTLDTLLGTYMSIIAVISILLNLLVLITFWKRQRATSSLEIYILNLALCDLCHALFAHPFVATSSFVHRWAFGTTGCYAHAFIVFFFGCSNICTLATISVMRYIKICHPNIDRHIGNKFVIGTLFPVYVISISWAIAPLLGWGAYSVEPFGTSCSLDWLHLSLSYIVTIFVMVFLVPICVMMFSYSNMVYVVYKARQNSKFSKKRMDIYLAKMACIMCICFMVAWTPYAIVSFMYTLRKAEHVSMMFTVVSPYIAKTSTVVNPLIYFVGVTRFRQDMYDVMRKMLGIQQPARESSTENNASYTRVGLIMVKQAIVKPRYYYDKYGEVNGIIELDNVSKQKRTTGTLCDSESNDKCEDSYTSLGEQSVLMHLENSEKVISDNVKVQPDIVDSVKCGSGIPRNILRRKSMSTDNIRTDSTITPSAYSLNALSSDTFQRSDIFTAVGRANVIDTTTPVCNSATQTDCSMCITSSYLDLDLCSQTLSQPVTGSCSLLSESENRTFENEYSKKNGRLCESNAAAFTQEIAQNIGPNNQTLFQNGNSNGKTNSRGPISNGKCCATGFKNSQEAEFQEYKNNTPRLHIRPACPIPEQPYFVHSYPDMEDKNTIRLSETYYTYGYDNNAHTQTNIVNPSHIIRQSVLKGMTESRSIPNMHTNIFGVKKHSLNKQVSCL